MRAIDILRRRSPIIGATDPYFSSTKLLLGFEGSDGSTTITDESSAARGSATVAGAAQIDTAQFKYGAAALLLDGTGDYISFPDSNDWDFGAGQFTVEAWARFSTGQTSDWCIASQWSSTGSNTAWALWWFSTSVGFRFTDSGGVTRDAFVSMTINADTWYHIAADRDGAGKVRLYQDGVYKGGTTNGQTIQASTNALRIGTVQDFPTYDLGGWLDEVRITKGVARYASDSGFTVPSAAFPRS